MLKEEIIENGKFVKHYSDTGMLIKQLETDKLLQVQVKDIKGLLESK